DPVQVPVLDPALERSPLAAALELAEGTEQGHAGLADALGELAGEILRHGGFVAGGLATRLEPADAVGEDARRFAVDHELGEAVREDGVGGEGDAVDVRLAGVLDEDLGPAPELGDQAHVRALVVHDREHLVPAAVLLAEKVLTGDPYVVEVDGVQAAA